ncbi:MAG: GDSL-type esterase/lipase family protein [Candidatus Sumerlaeota bacterium]|nr:GDSL-type esterase/lipase family protein [Candidatus Sumerlaeota bacterium]
MRIRKRWIWITLLLVAAAAAWWLRPFQQGYVANSPPPNPRLVMLGDSMTAGVGASAGQDLPSQLSRLIRRPVLNAGASGETIHDGLLRVDRLLARGPGTVIVFLGGNDRLQKIPLERSEADLRQIVQRIQRARAMVVLVGFSGTPGDGYESMFERVARDCDCLFVPDVLSGIFFNPSMKADPIHPNDKGYALIAERIADKMKPYLGP